MGTMTLRLFGTNISLPPKETPPPLSPPPSPPPPAVAPENTNDRKHWHRFEANASPRREKNPKIHHQSDENKSDRDDRENSHHRHQGEEQDRYHRHRRDHEHQDPPRRHHHEGNDQESTRNAAPATKKGVKIHHDLWHYTTDLGRAKGPFSIHLLKKWRSLDMMPATRVWRAVSTDSINLATLIGYYDDASCAGGIQTWMYENSKGEMHGPRSLDELRSHIAKLPRDVRVWKIGQSQDRVALRDLLEIEDDEESQPRKRAWEEEREEEERKRWRRDREDRRERVWRSGSECKFFKLGICRNGRKCPFVHAHHRRDRD